MLRLKFLLFLKKEKTWRTNIPSVLACVCVCVCAVYSGLFTLKLQTCFAENHIMSCRLFRHTHVCSLKRQTLVHWSFIHPSLPYSVAVHAVCSVSSFFWKKKLDGPAFRVLVCVCECVVYSDVLRSKIQTCFAENQTMPFIQTCWGQSESASPKATKLCVDNMSLLLWETNVN